MKYRLVVYDNFHYMDDDEPYEKGEYETYELALADAKLMIESFLEFNWKNGMTPDQLIDVFNDFGEEPTIIPRNNDNGEIFSARKYVKEIAESICKKLQKQSDTQWLYQRAINFASSKHSEMEQKVPGTNLPYVVHLSNVAMEIMIAGAQSDNFNTGFAVQIALLHDTIEDTYTTFDELREIFGIDIAEAVFALTKNNELPAELQMADSLKRIKELPNEVWAVKLADRITNLQPPPSHWGKEKKAKYIHEALLIYDELKDANDFLANRLLRCMEDYKKSVF